MLVCKWCLEEIQVLKSGDEQWNYCEGCHQVEGDVQDTEEDL